MKLVKKDENEPQRKRERKRPWKCASLNATTIYFDEK